MQEPTRREMREGRRGWNRTSEQVPSDLPGYWRRHVRNGDHAQHGKLCITKTPSSGFPSNVTLLLPGRLLNPASSSLPHAADFNGIRHGWDLRDPQSVRVRTRNAA